MILTHKTECFPDLDQAQFFERCFGMRRFFFNKTIMTLKHKYGDLKENSKVIKSKEIMSYRKDLILAKYRDLKVTVPDQVLYTTMEDVVKSIDSLKKKGKNISLRKKKHSNTFRICKSGVGNTFWYKNGEKFIGLPQFSKYKLQNLKMAESLRWDDANIRTVTITKDAERFFISITCELPDLPRYKSQNKKLAIDWGIKTYITGFDGSEIFSLDFDKAKLDKLDKHIAKSQKSLGRKIRFSNNWKKAKTKLQQKYLDFNNYRLDFIKQCAFCFNEDYDSVVLENLGMKFVTSNRHLARRAMQKPFYLLKNCIINKFNQTGKKVYLVPKTFPSTQTCNSCGNIKTGKDKMKLGEKVYHCHSCGTIHDRDENAAKNIWSFNNLEIAVIEE